MSTSSSNSQSSSLGSSISSISSSSSFELINYRYDNVTGVLLDKTISIDIKNIATENSVDVQVTLFSRKFSHADIEFWYRTGFGEKWMDDAFISSSTATFINGNKLFRLPCSEIGYKNIIRWQYENNKLTTGNEIQIKIKIIPSASVLSYYKDYTTIENVYCNFLNEIESVVPYRIFGIDGHGNYMCFNDNKFLIVNKNKDIIMQYSNIKNVMCCQQIYNGNYMILDNEDKKIVEISKEGVLIYEFQSGVLFYNPYYFVYDKYLNNVLITDNKNGLYELSWNENNKGDVIWQYNDLSYPTCAIYDSNNRAVIWVGDSGNKRIVKVDRSTFENVISTYNSFTKDGINVNFNTISKMFTNKDDLIVVEQEQEQEFFNENINLHPALARAMNLKQDGISTKNNLNDYRNLLFAPVTKTVDLGI